MKFRIKKVLLVLSTLLLIVYIGISFVLPRVLLKLSREISSSTAADYGMRYDKIDVLSEDSLMLYGDFIYPFHREYNKETSTHSMIVLHPLKTNTKIIYPFLKSINTLDVNFITFDSRAHGRSEGHLYSMGVNEAKDISKIIDYILELHPDHSFGIYAKGNTGNIALRAMENDKRIRYGIIEKYDKHPLEVIERLNYDDVFFNNKTIQDYVLHQSLKYLNIDKNENTINLDSIDRPILLLKTENNTTELNLLESKLTYTDVFHMYFPDNPYLLINYLEPNKNKNLIQCLQDFISTQSISAINDAKTNFFTPVTDSTELQVSK